MDVMDSGDDSDDDPMLTEMLEYVRDINQSHPKVNKRAERYKIRDHMERSVKRYATHV